MVFLLQDAPPPDSSLPQTCLFGLSPWNVRFERAGTLSKLQATAKSRRRTCRLAATGLRSAPSQAFLAATAAWRATLLRVVPSFKACRGQSEPVATFQLRNTPPLATEQCPWRCTQPNGENHRERFELRCVGHSGARTLCLPHCVAAF